MKNSIFVVAGLTVLLLVVGNEASSLNNLKSDVRNDEDKAVNLRESSKETIFDEDESEEDLRVTSDKIPSGKEDSKPPRPAPLQSMSLTDTRLTYLLRYIYGKYVSYCNNTNGINKFKKFCRLASEIKNKTCPAPNPGTGNTHPGDMDNLLIMHILSSSSQSQVTSFLKHLKFLQSLNPGKEDSNNLLLLSIIAGSGNKSDELREKLIKHIIEKMVSNLAKPSSSSSFGRQDITEPTSTSSNTEHWLPLSKYQDQMETVWRLQDKNGTEE